MDALDSIDGKVSVVYADPPYTRDHYSRFYHVLETLCLRDNPAISTVRINGEDHTSRGIYRDKRHQSPFCIRSKAPEAFSTLFSRVQKMNVPLVLSYSPYKENSGARRRVLTIEKIEGLAQKYFKKVEILQAGNISHNKIGNSKIMDSSYDAEIFLICNS
jgi:adenine-specific DNA methylase